jgi:nuclear transcription Y subunit beta
MDDQVDVVPSTPPLNSNKGLLLPKTTIYNIMKSSLPPHAKTADKARELMQNCVTEFIMFVTGEYVIGMPLNKCNTHDFLDLHKSAPFLTNSNYKPKIRASDICKKSDKKTIGGDDILEALKNLGFDEYLSPLRIYLSKYRQVRFHPHPFPFL